MKEKKITNKTSLKHNSITKNDMLNAQANDLLGQKQGYKAQEIEGKWREVWDRNKTFSPNISGAAQPFYNLMMFPYPSAEGMHVGNMYAFTGADIYGRFKRMQGYDVLEPIGLDGFGIHSENYALKIGKHPMDQAKISEKNFYRQLRATGNSYDWIRTVETYDPEYYRWTQWLFIQMFKNGLAYRKKATVNYCPSCKTVLADEQVIPASPSSQGGDGKCERCSSIVEKRELEQWFFRITDYAERLLDNIDPPAGGLNWSEKVKIAQRNWIGKSEGTRIEFPIVNEKYILEVFTTRPDTLFGVTFMVVSPEHPLVVSLLNLKFKIENLKLNEVKEYIKIIKKKTNTNKNNPEKEKDGVFSGLYAINPVNNEQIPVWISDYVLMDYGTGAIMAVPAHDERDFEFAKKYDLPIKVVIEPTFGNEAEGEEFRRSIVALVRNPVNNTFLSINWGKDKGGYCFVGGGIEENEDVVDAAKREIQEETGYKNLKFITKTEKVHHHYYSHTKNIYRKLEVIGLYFELQDQEKDEVRPEEYEKNKYMVEWISENQVEERIKDQLHRFVFDRFVHNYVYSGSGLLVNSADWNTWEVPQKLGEVINWIEENGIGKAELSFHLRDWLISRQRYWGPPIPMIYCQACADKGKSWFTAHKTESPHREISNIKSQISNKEKIGNSSEAMHGWYPVPEQELPVELPYIEDYKPLGTRSTGSGQEVKSPLASHEEFYKTTCTGCGGEAVRETDVSDTFLDSAWYFLRYPSTDIQNNAFDIERTKKWLPVNMYIGGAEHSVLHLLYARFVTMVLYDMGLLDFEEPFSRFFAHGLLIKEGVKMSKSKGNVIIPDDYIEKYGADTLRVYLMFLGPFSQGGDFYDTGIEGMNRFLKRVWYLLTGKVKITKQEEDREVLRLLHKTIKEVTQDIEQLSYNTAIARLMEFYNGIAMKNALSEASALSFLKLLAPFAPFMSEELYHMITKVDEKQSIHLEKWPSFDEKMLVQDVVKVIVQVNGKVRGTLEIQNSKIKDQNEIEKMAKENEHVQKYLDGKAIKNIIFVPGKIINFVLT